MHAFVAAFGLSVTLASAAAQTAPKPLFIPHQAAPASGHGVGLENQLYRVEIHKGRSSGTFNWSHADGSKATEPARSRRPR
jgi:hypothetical protein